MFSHSRGAATSTARHEPHGDQYEYRRLTLARGTSRAQARALITEQAEHGRWELATLTLYVGGARSVLLRRRILRVQRTL